jgi:hypothetical protein
MKNLFIDRYSTAFAERILSLSFGRNLSLCLLVALITANSSFSQSYQSDVDIIQAKFGLDKKIAVANFMKLGDDADSFWQLYNEYEEERKKLGKERIDVIIDYAANYPNIADDKILELYKRSTAIKRSFDKLQQTYFERMKKEIGVSKAAQFWQLENYFSSMVQATIYSEIPFIGENLEGR